MSQSFFERSLEVRKGLLLDDKILQVIPEVFMSHYIGKPLSKGVIEIGEGRSNTVYSIGQIFEGEKPAFLALRLRNNPSLIYDDQIDTMLKDELASTELVHEAGFNTINFQLAIIVKNFLLEKDAIGLGGIIMEDLTQGNTKRVIYKGRELHGEIAPIGGEKMDVEKLRLVNNGKTETYHIDLCEILGEKVSIAKKYFLSEARIDLRGVD